MTEKQRRGRKSAQNSIAKKKIASGGPLNDTFQKQGAVVVGKIKQGTRYNLDHGALRYRQAPFARRTASTACPK